MVQPYDEHQNSYAVYSCVYVERKFYFNKHLSG
uniref:Uncharacterized protein n=1 Tax=Tetranychus urticae TaxID=32264 RepID=T1KHP8_TETUR